MARHPENEPLAEVIAFRPEASVIYVNAEAIFDAVVARLRTSTAIRLVVCDLSASPYLDLAGTSMLHDLHTELSTRSIPLRIVGAHGVARDLLRAEGVDRKVAGLDRTSTLDALLAGKSE